MAKGKALEGGRKKYEFALENKEHAKTSLIEI